MSLEFTQLGVQHDQVAVVLVDHGSRRDESNHLLLEVVEAYQKHADWRIVEPAHMELAEPSILTAFRRCIELGAELVIVFPYFLGPGRHWNSDIPRLAAQAAEECGGVRYLVTSPLGLHRLMMQVIDERIAEAIDQPTDC
ncbi:MAG: hypothetical protein KDA57_06200 [Planctomycetales bacterium]|nr:hypothetical protein [Planctomycetales bacterium]